MAVLHLREETQVSVRIRKFGACDLGDMAAGKTDELRNTHWRKKIHRRLDD